MKLNPFHRTEAPQLEPHFNKLRYPVIGLYAIAAGLFFEDAQTDYQIDPSDDNFNPTSTAESLAHTIEATSIDWKSTVFAVGAFSAANAIRRVRRSGQSPKIDSTKKFIHAATLTVPLTAALIAGEHMSTSENIIAGGVGVLAAEVIYKTTTWRRK